MLIEIESSTSFSYECRVPLKEDSFITFFIVSRSGISRTEITHEKRPPLKWNEHIFVGVVGVVNNFARSS